MAARFTRWGWFLLSTVGVLAAAACSANTAPTQPGSSASAPVVGSSLADSRARVDGMVLASAEEAASIVRIYCGHLRTTEVDDESERIQAALRTSCEDDRGELLAIGAARVSRAGWAKCHAHLMSLEGPLDHDIGDAPECAEWFVGQLGAGASCTSREVCTEGLYCDDLTTRTCMPRLPLGASCAETLMGNPCERGLRCSGSTDGPPTQKTCVALPKHGERCAGHCYAPAFCIAGVCRARRGEEGERCQPGVPGCGTGLYCDFATGACLPRRPRGAKCDIHSQCASGACFTPPRVGETTCR